MILGIGSSDSGLEPESPPLKKRACHLGESRDLPYKYLVSNAGESRDLYL